MAALKLVDCSMVSPGVDLTAVTAVRLDRGKWMYKEFPVVAIVVKRLRPTVETPGSEDVLDYSYLVTDGGIAPLELEMVASDAMAAKVFKATALPLTDFHKQELVDLAIGQPKQASNEVLQNPSNTMIARHPRT